MILKPLTKIRITEGPLKYTPGSLGYVICQSQYFGFNIWSTAVLFHRVGKKGKDRLEMAVLRDDIIDYDSTSLPKKEREIIKTVETLENLHPWKYLGEPGGKKSGLYYADHTQYEIVKSEYKNTLDMPTWEFISYMAAASMLVFSLTHNSGAENLINSRLGLHKQSLGNFPEEPPNPKLIWEVLRKGLKVDVRNKNNDFETKCRKYFDVAQNRADYIRRIRRALAGLVESFRQHSAYLNKTESSVRNHILQAIKYYRGNPADLKEAKDLKRVLNGPRLPKVKKTHKKGA